MRFDPAFTAAALIAAGTLSVSAQQHAAAGISARAAAGNAGVARSTVSRASVSRVRTDALTTIQGNALNSTNGPLNDMTVRLRDARFGTIVDTQQTDKSGLFSFKSVDPGTYIVEVMANDQSLVLAASQLLNVNAGEAVSAVVKLPFRIPPFAGVLGNTAMPSAGAIATQAAANGIAAIVPTSPVSPTG